MEEFFKGALGCVSEAMAPFLSRTGASMARETDLESSGWFILAFQLQMIFGVIINIETDDIDRHA